jgi:signal transduction histidine kinase
VIDVALATGFVTLMIGLLGTLLLPRLPTLRSQIIALAMAATLLPMVAVTVAMGGADATFTAVTVAASGSALVGGLVLGQVVMRSVDRLRRASVVLSTGDFEARAPEDGPAELAELGAAMNRMAADIREISDARRRLVAWASHDLRTPLANMQAMLEALEDGLGNEERYLPALREQVRTLDGIVDDLFELARIDAGRLTLELEEAELDGLVLGCLGGFAAEAEARRVRLESQVVEPLPRVRCAPDKIERVVLNLVTNALRHTPGDGTVAVRLVPAPNEVVVSVEDSGAGIPAESLDQAFEPFWRGDLSRSKPGGAGLGLAIARGLVHAHGGRVWAESRAEGGTRVTFTLPVTRADPVR